MNLFFAKYVDLVSLLLVLLLPALFTRNARKTAGKTIRLVPTYFLFLGPTALLVLMFFHVFENSYNAIDRVVKGVFVYNFRFYSLLLLGVVLFSFGWELFRLSRQKCTAAVIHNRPYFLQWLKIAVFNAPLIPIIPIAAAPLFFCTLSLGALGFVRRRKKAVIDVAVNEEKYVAALN